jgi:hypothetical protein
MIGSYLYTSQFSEGDQQVSKTYQLQLPESTIGRQTILRDLVAMATGVIKYGMANAYGQTTGLLEEYMITVRNDQSASHKHVGYSLAVELAQLDPLILQKELKKEKGKKRRKKEDRYFRDLRTSRNFRYLRTSRNFRDCVICVITNGDPKHFETVQQGPVQLPSCLFSAASALLHSIGLKTRYFGEVEGLLLDGKSHRDNSLTQQRVATLLVNNLNSIIDQTRTEDNVKIDHLEASLYRGAAFIISQGKVKKKFSPNWNKQKELTWNLGIGILRTAAFGVLGSSDCLHSGFDRDRQTSVAVVDGCTTRFRS